MVASDVTKGRPSTRRERCGSVALGVMLLVLSSDASAFSNQPRSHVPGSVPTSGSDRERVNNRASSTVPLRVFDDTNTGVAELYGPAPRGGVGNERGLGEAVRAPPSQVESVVANAKDLMPASAGAGEEDGGRKDVALRSVAAGAAVALAMVPEAVAFSFVAGVSPLVGLWTTVTLGATAASLGGRAGVCSSASGACSVVVAALCASRGPSYLAACATLAGGLQVAAGALGLGKFIRLVPHPVMLGFVNGLSLVMGRSQLVHFRDAATGRFVSPFTSAGATVYGLAAATMALMNLLPRLSTTTTTESRGSDEQQRSGVVDTIRKIVGAVPPSLGAVGLATLASMALKLPAQTLADIAGADTFSGGLSVLPKLHILPNLRLLTSLDSLRTILPYAATMATVGIIESLLTMQILDGMADDGARGSTRRECVAQGLGNVASGLTGGIGGCALLGQSIINMRSGGGASRLSGVSASLLLGVGVVAAAPLVGAVPVAALVGVMLEVCRTTFAWGSLRLWNRVPALDAAVVAGVTLVTVAHDLAAAVLLGTAASAVGFAWKQSTAVSVSRTRVATSPSAVKEYALSGPLFFGSASRLGPLFDVRTDPDTVVVDFSDSRVCDHSALEAIHDLADRYGAAGKRVKLRHLSPDCARLLARARADGELPPYEIVEADPDTDPEYGLADDYS